MLAFKDEEAQILTRLGLTPCQAKIYLSLVQSGTSTVKKISRFSRVAREHVYRSILTLQELGLVEKVVTTPVMFKAIPMKETLSMLMTRKIKETSELKARTRELLEKSIQNEAKDPPEEEDSKFVLIPADHPTDRWFEKRINATQTSFDSLISQEAFMYMDRWTGVFKKALKRGVKCRHIIHRPKSNNSLPEIDPDLKKNPNFKIRYILTRPPATVTLYDKKEAFVSTTSLDPREAPSLWTTTPGLVAILQDYFEILWLKAMEEIPEKH